MSHEWKECLLTKIACASSKITVWFWLYSNEYMLHKFEYSMKTVDKPKTYEIFEDGMSKILKAQNMFTQDEKPSFQK